MAKGTMAERENFINPKVVLRAYETGEPLNVFRPC